MRVEPLDPVRQIYADKKRREREEKRALIVMYLVALSIAGIAMAIASSH